MKTTIYFNPECSKCNEALCTLQERGEDVEIIEYLKNTPTVKELQDLLTMLRLKPIDIVRTSEPVFIEKYTGKQLSDDDLLSAMVQDPILIQRPIVVKGNKAIIGRPVERVIEIL